MLWAAAVLCFFGFFRAGELTLSSQNAYDSNKHLSWGDVAIDNPQCPKTLKIRLKSSKTDHAVGKRGRYIHKQNWMYLMPNCGSVSIHGSAWFRQGPILQVW